jgi:hypothetical protein
MAKGCRNTWCEVSILLEGIKRLYSCMRFVLDYAPHCYSEVRVSNSETMSEISLSRKEQATITKPSQTKQEHRE